MTIFLVPDEAFKLSKRSSTGIFLLYVLLYYLILFFQKNTNGVFGMQDFFILAALAFLVEHRPKRIIIIQKQDLIEFDIVYRAIFLIALFYYSHIRHINIPFLFRDSGKDFLIFLLLTIALIIFNTILATSLRFLQLSFRKIKLKDTFILFGYMLLLVTPLQEILFRVWIYGLLLQFIHLKWLSLFIGSVIFGSVHLKYGGWRLACLAVFAGLVYGLIFVLTNNILYSIMSHVIVNIIWKNWFQKIKEVKFEVSKLEV